MAKGKLLEAMWLTAQERQTSTFTLWCRVIILCLGEQAICKMADRDD